MKRIWMISIVFSLVSSMPFAFPSSAQDPPEPAVSEVAVGQSNISGIFRFDLYVNGTTEGIAKSMNFTFSIQNATGTTDGPWIDPIDAIFFGNGIQFKAAGSLNNSWSKWRLHIQITYDIERGPGFIIGLFEGLLGVNVSDVDPDRIDNVDINNTKAFFKVRAYDSNGNYAETKTEITDELKSAFFPGSPSGDGDSGGGESDGEDLTVPIILIAIGATLIFIALVAWIFYFRKKGNEKRGMGYVHEKF